MKIKRMFLAFWPNADQLEKLTAVQADYAGWGRKVLPENLHITLLFLGNISNDISECFIHSIEQIRAQAFHLRLDRLGYFEKKQIFWAGPSVTPQALENLFKSARNCASQCGIAKLSKRYVPHVSLLRKCRAPMTHTDCTPVEWDIEDFHLVESRIGKDGARYYTLKSFALRNL